MATSAACSSARLLAIIGCLAAYTASSNGVPLASLASPAGSSKGVARHPIKAAFGDGVFVQFSSAARINISLKKAVESKLDKPYKKAAAPKKTKPAPKKKAAPKKKTTKKKSTKKASFTKPSTTAKPAGTCYSRLHTDHTWCQSNCAVMVTAFPAWCAFN